MATTGYVLEILRTIWKDKNLTSMPGYDPWAVQAPIVVAMSNTLFPLLNLPFKARLASPVTEKRHPAGKLYGILMLK